MIHTMKRDVIYDLDGSFSQVFDGIKRDSATIVHGFPHILAYNQDKCPLSPNSADWDDAVMCNSEVTIRRVMFGNLQNKQLFVSQSQKAAQLPDLSAIFAANSSSDQYSSVTSQGFLAM